MEVKLNVRTPSQSGTDVELSCHLDWSVLRVKEEIQQLFESHPRVEDQRLVYFGKFLDNDALLEQVLRLDHENSSYTVHLVCRQLNNTNTDTNSGLRKRVTPATTAAAEPTTSTNESTASSNTNDQQESQQQQQQPQQSIYNNFDPAAWMSMYGQQEQNVIPNSQQNSAGVAQNNFYMQQMYAHYMAQYMQYLQSANAAGATATNTGPAFLPQGAAGAPHGFYNFANVFPPGYNAGAAAAVAAAPQPGAAAAAAPAPAVAPVAAQPVAGDQNPVLNAAGQALGGAVEDDEMEGQRDILDWFYVLSRILVLFSIVYFYSSFTRFVVVVSFGMFAYLWNIGFFRRRQQGQQQQQRQARADPAPPARAADDEQELIQQQVNEVRQAATGEGNRQRPEGGGDAAADADEAATPENQDAGTEDDSSVDGGEGGRSGAAANNAVVNQASFVDVAVTFVTSFFYSLFPGQQQIGV